MDAAGTFTKLDDSTSPQPTRIRVVEEEKGKIPELKLCGGGNFCPLQSPEPEILVSTKAVCFKAR
jgi:hypothetical protein